MNKKLLFGLMPVVALSLTACGGVNDYKEHLQDYVHAEKFHDKYNVLQLTDIHWNYNSSTNASISYLNKLFKEVDEHVKNVQGKEAKIDLVEVTGDTFMLANTYHVTTFLGFMEEKATQYNFKYTIIWGNHDRHGLYNPNWLSNQFVKAEHCIYIEPDDNLYGRSNFVINLTLDGNAESKTKWQLANLDSGASFSETAISPFRDYDYIREDQVDWFIKEHDAVGKDVPVIAYYHIPQQDNLEAWNAIHKNGKAMKHKFFKLEGFADNGTEEYASKFIAEGRKNNLKGAFMGHAHNVDWTVDYDGLILGLGVKTGTELYFAHIEKDSEDENMKEGLASVGINENFDLIGASLVTLNDGDTFDLEHLYLNERETNDFVRWVKW